MFGTSKFEWRKRGRPRLAARTAAAVAYLQNLDGVDMRSQEDSAAPIVRMMTCVRNRDMLLCYLRHRLTKIESARWDVAGKLPDDSLELLDTTTAEPLAEGSKLWCVPNVVLTPHTAGETCRYELNVLDFLDENLRRLWAGETELVNQVI